MLVILKRDGEEISLQAAQLIAQFREDAACWLF